MSLNSVDEAKRVAGQLGRRIEEELLQMAVLVRNDEAAKHFDKGTALKLIAANSVNPKLTAQEFREFVRHTLADYIGK